MGHASAKVTLDTYCHLMPSNSDEKSSTLGRVLA
jgi:hypothetical protein